MILAGIDIGTNTLRLLIADTGPGSLRELQSARTITRLGEGLSRTGILSPGARDRSIRALVDFKQCIERYRVARIQAVGTSALRNAKNAGDFLDAVRERTGIVITVITGEQEARLSLLGVDAAIAHHFRSPADSGLLVVDIGGGSTEIIQRERSQGVREASLPLGAVYLTERFIRRDPPLAGDLDAMRRSIRSELEQSIFSRLVADVALVGTAGTITTLAAIDQRLVLYDPEKINGSTLTRETVDALVLKLGRMPLRERRKIPGLEPGREDIILAGAIVIQEIMHRFGFEAMLVSDWGLREGILLDLYDRIITGTADGI